MQCFFFPSEMVGLCLVAVTYLDSLHNLYERELECHIVPCACKLYPHLLLQNINFIMMLSSRLSPLRLLCCEWPSLCHCKKASGMICCQSGPKWGRRNLLLGPCVNPCCSITRNNLYRNNRSTDWGVTMNQKRTVTSIKSWNHDASLSRWPVIPSF